MKRCSAKYKGKAIISLLIEATMKSLSRNLRVKCNGGHFFSGPKFRWHSINRQGNQIKFSELLPIACISIDVSELFLLSHLTVIHFHWYGESEWPSYRNALFPLSFQLKNMLALTNAPTQYLGHYSVLYCYLWDILTLRCISFFFLFFFITLRIQLCSHRKLQDVNILSLRKQNMDLLAYKINCFHWWYFKMSWLLWQQWRE